MKSPDFAQWFVAGRLAAAGWVVYRPHRRGAFRFIIARPAGTRPVLRPLTIVGVYPPAGTDVAGYGYNGCPGLLHPDMVLALAFFRRSIPEIPAFVLYLPVALLEVQEGEIRCEPAALRGGMPVVKSGYRPYLDDEGLRRLERDE